MPTRETRAEHTSRFTFSPTPSYPLEKLFIDFVGPLVRSKRGNIAILVVVDGFSKFVSLYPVRKINFQVVMECLERHFFLDTATTSALLVVMPWFFVVKDLKIYVFGGECNT